MLKKLPDWSEAETKAKLAEAEAISQRLQKNNKPATVAWTARQIEHLSKEVADYILDLREAMRDLEARVAITEEKGMRYCGIHDKGQQYGRGDCVTAKGALWFAEKDTRGVPGSANSGFRLMHKSVAARGNRNES